MVTITYIVPGIRLAQVFGRHASYVPIATPVLKPDMPVEEIA